MMCAVKSVQVKRVCEFGSKVLEKCHSVQSRVLQGHRGSAACHSSAHSQAHPLQSKDHGQLRTSPVALTASAGGLAQTLKPMPISALSLFLTSQQHSQNFFSFFSQTYLYREGSCDLIILGTLHLLMPGQSAK